VSATTLSSSTPTVFPHGIRGQLFAPPRQVLGTPWVSTGVLRAPRFRAALVPPEPHEDESLGRAGQAHRAGPKRTGVRCFRGLEQPSRDQGSPKRAGEGFRSSPPETSDRGADGRVQDQQAVFTVPPYAGEGASACHQRRWRVRVLSRRWCRPHRSPVTDWHASTSTGRACAAAGLFTASLRNARVSSLHTCRSLDTVAADNTTKTVQHRQAATQLTSSSPGS
jgi:hypothetical protein